MHFEFLVEDKSGKLALQSILPKILGDFHSYRIHAYRGIGHLPQDLRTAAQPQHRALLSQLPRLLHGYASVFSGYPPDYQVALILVCDLDQQCRRDLRLELLRLLDACEPRPETYFFIAEEEGEAWFLGDTRTIKMAYPNAKLATLDDYKPDQVCGTWEKLADAVHSGGAKSLKNRQYFEVGAVKCRWAIEISVHMDVESNSSPSFQYFRDKLRRIVR